MGVDVEDLRGRDFRWTTSGTSGKIMLIEDPVEVGHIARVPDARPVFFAEFAGTRWRIDHAVTTVGPVFGIVDPDGEVTIGRSHYTSAVELRLVLGERSYTLRRPTSSTTTWHDGSEDVVSFQRQARQAFVLMGADSDDAPALLIMGVVMAVENTLFTKAP